MSTTTVADKNHENQVCIAGLLAKDPVVRFTGSGKKVTSATVCTEPTAKKKEFHRVTAWEGLADTIETIHQGEFVEVFGRLRTSSWEKDGQKHYSTEIAASLIIKASDVANVTRGAVHDEIAF